MKKTGKIWVALITALSLAMPMNVWADTKITSISLKIDSSIEAGDSDSDVYVTTSSRYCSVDDVEVTNEPSDEWKSGARPKIKVTKSSDGDANYGTGRRSERVLCQLRTRRRTVPNSACECNGAVFVLVRG